MKVKDLVRNHILNVFLEMESDGKSRQSIAKHLGISIRTLRNYLNSYREDGFSIEVKQFKHSVCTNINYVPSGIYGMATNDERLAYADNPESKPYRKRHDSNFNNEA